jgi:phage FluMu protein Com
VNAYGARPSDAYSPWNLREERCPMCRALLLKVKADGAMEIKCHKCGLVVRRQLNRT